MDLSIRVIALILCCDRSRFASRHPHLSVVQVFKDRFCCAVSFDSSAAEKRDYEELRTTRQALHPKSFTALPLPPPAENPGAAERCALYTLQNSRQLLAQQNTHLPKTGHTTKKFTSRRWNRWVSVIQEREARKKTSAPT